MIEENETAKKVVLDPPPLIVLPASMLLETVITRDVFGALPEITPARVARRFEEI